MRYSYDAKLLVLAAQKVGLTTGQTAMRAGLSRQAVSDAMRGVREPKASTLAALATAWRVSPAVFFKESGR